MRDKRNAAPRLKVMHVVYSFGIGGSESVAREVAFSLQDRGHANMVVALEHDGPLSGEFAGKGITALAVDRANKTTWQAMREVRQACARFRPDVIHTHHFYMLYYAVYAALRHRVPIVHTEHEFWSLDTTKGRLFLPVLSRLCGKVTAVNDDTRRFMREKLHLPEGKLTTVLNGIDLRRFNSETRLTRDSVGLAGEDKVAVIVARLEPVKNHAMLIRAWKRVAEVMPEAKLLIVGEGSQDALLREQAATLGVEGNVLFLGPRRDVHDLMPLADIAVLSSRDEGLPMCLLEAMACELPVVATDVGGVARLVENGQNGLLVPDDDDAKMAEGILELFGEPALCGEMGDRARSGVVGRYDLETSVDRYEDLYYALSRNHGVG